MSRTCMKYNKTDIGQDEDEEKKKKKNLTLSKWKTLLLD